MMNTDQPLFGEMMRRDSAVPPVDGETFKDLQIGPVRTNAKGGRFCQITQNGWYAFILPSGNLVAPFGAPTKYDAAPSPQQAQSLTGRLTWELRCDEELERTLSSLDAWLLSYLTPEETERVFSKRMTREQVKAACRSTLRRKDGYDPTARIKINLGGPKGCRFWNANGNEIEMPEDWRACEFKVRLLVSGLWLMNGQADIGVTLLATDIQVFPKPRACPFKRRHGDM